MALAVCLLFDGRSQRAIRNLWDRLEDSGVPTLRTHTHGKHQPHLSYVVLLRWELEQVRAAVEALPRREPFDLTFDALGSFRRGRVCMIPSLPDDLVGRQQAVVEAARRTGALVHRNYEIGQWLPHLSLVTRAQLEMLPKAALAVYQVLPLTIRVTKAALIDSSTGRLWPLATLP